LHLSNKVKETIFANKGTRASLTYFRAFVPLEIGALTPYIGPLRRKKEEKKDNLYWVGMALTFSPELEIERLG